MKLSGLLQCHSSQVQRRERQKLGALDTDGQSFQGGEGRRGKEREEQASEGGASEVGQV